MFHPMKTLAVRLICTAGMIALSLTGCATNWADLTPDKQEAPASLVQNEQRIFEARQRVRETVRFEGKKPIYTYNKSWFGKLTQAQVDDTLTGRFGQSLTKNFGRVQGLSVTKAGISYLVIHYQVTGITVQDSAKKASKHGMSGVVGASFHDRQSGHIVQATGNGIQLFVATVKAHVQMVDQRAGKTVFSCDIQASGAPSPICTQNDLNDCVDLLAKQALREYQFRFGPPVYVTESRSNGKMVQLNIGTDRGVTPGMQFRFFTRNEQGREQPLGTGYVRADVPEDLGPDYARLIVNEPDHFRVMKNILAKPVR